MRSLKQRREKGLAEIKIGGKDLFITKTGGAVILTAPSSAPTRLDTSQISFWLDERGNSLKVSVKYSDGTLKTATIPLT